MPGPDDATNADRAPRRVAAQAGEVTRRRHAWLAAREEARRLKEDYDAAVLELYAAIAAEVMPLPPSSVPEGGPDPLFRIAICGYDTDGYAELEALGWEVVAWRSSGGYSNQSKRKNINRDRERIWFSPSCLKPTKEPMPLFDGLEDD